MNYIEQIYNAIDPREVARMAKSMKDGWIEVILSGGELRLTRKYTSIPTLLLEDQILVCRIDIRNLQRIGRMQWN